MANPRSYKVAERIHEIVASMVTMRLKDPRLNLVTITDVRVTGDLQHATVFYTVYGSDAERKAAGRALERAKGLIRSHVGGQLGLRLTPSLEFVPDALPETARSFEDALVAARFRDEQIRKSAEGAQWAGDAEPYRKPREIEKETDATEVEETGVARPGVNDPVGNASTDGEAAQRADSDGGPTAADPATE
ncbi:30S ribosome-binding factor RbfA [Actinobaculum sp. 352]|uniref:30S ribosome-binding factor RbfA n=1 Tax=Actinobaculum sp. 352 TaxID=2490946 RepID=UPI000F7EF3AD|nr:30S ribosome-binding factor RbfA [Actinobaculum sp. 352]RTE47972.1 30S ribosome-binding factor RbfA [Actinobaculum sp. 352]